MSQYSMETVAALSRQEGINWARAQIAQEILKLNPDNPDIMFTTGFIRAKFAAVKIALGETSEPDAEN
jgi:hypothetical protein